MARWLGVPMVGLLLVPGAAQDGFEALFATAEALPVDQREQRFFAFTKAYRAFAALPADSAAYRQGLAKGAQSALFAARPAAALPLFEELHRRQPVDPITLRWRLTAMVRAGQGAAAVTLAQARIEAFRAGVHEWLRGTIEWLPRTSDFGRLAALGGELLQAADDRGLWLLQGQDAAMQDRPGREYALANLGLAYRQLGRTADAERSYRQALELAPRTAWVWNDFGLLLKGVGRLQEAATAFATGLEQETEPGGSAAGTNLGVLFQRTGSDRGRDPRADLVRVLRLRPDSALARRLLLDGLRKRR